MSDGDLPSVFDRIYQVDQSRSRATGGAGLVLTIARKLLEAHGGSMRAKSLKGSRFIFDLPVEASNCGDGGK